MICNKCGSNNPDSAGVCIGCGEILPKVQLNTNNFQGSTSNYQPGIINIPNYMTQAILLLVFSAICCCLTYISFLALPFAIVAIVYASQVNSKISLGDLAGAAESSKMAKTWCWVSFWILMGSIVLQIIIFVILVAIGGASEFLNEFNRRPFAR